MEEIMVSIICNVYNQENYISKCLDSLLMQKTKFDYEILVHDDASSDRTPEIIREYEEKFPSIVKPIYQTINQYSLGTGITFNIQYPRAKGKYIAYCEGDDYWTDEKKLQIQVDFLEKNNNYIGCVHRYNVVDENNNPKNIKTFGEYFEEDVYTLSDFEKKELPSQIATLVHRNIFDKSEVESKIDFYNSNIQGDIKLYLALLSYAPIYRMNLVMSAYRFVLNGSSWSSNYVSKPNGFLYFKRLKEFRKQYFFYFKKKIKLKNRLDKAALKTISDALKFKGMKFKFYALRILLIYPRVYISIFKRIFRKKI